MYTSSWFASLNQILYGDDDRNFFFLNRGDHTVLRSKGGNDYVHLGGTATYSVDLGWGDDYVAIFGDGAVEAQGGAGRDSFRVDSMAEHVITGGSGVDTLSFLGQDEGLWIDVGAGTAIGFDQWPWGPVTRGPTVAFSQIEVVHGTQYDDLIFGDGWHNHLVGGDGEDVIEGGAGNDTIEGGRGSDRLYGGEGDDVIYIGPGMWAKNAGFADGGAGDDVIYGGAAGTEIRGGDGDDTIYAGHYNDGVLTGYRVVWVNDGRGDDVVYGSSKFAGRYKFYDGEDVFIGGSRESDHVQVYADADVDVFHGGSNDRSDREGGVDRLHYVEGGGVFIDAREGRATGEAAGGATSFVDGDTITVTQHYDVFTGFESFIGGRGDDQFRGSDNAAVEEWFTGRDGDDVFYGSRGMDNFNGGTTAYFNWSKPRTDSEREQYANTVDYAEFGGRVVVNLGAGVGDVRDYADGGRWEHTYVFVQDVVGSRHHDTLIGSDEANRIEGRQGNDRLTGEGDADTFVFSGLAGGIGFDTIVDFTRGQDVLELTHMRGFDGRIIDDFADLDTNGDSVLTGADATMIAWGQDATLATASGYVQLMNVTELTADDFAFA